MATMHIDEVKRLAQQAHADAKEREALFDCMLHNDGREAYVASWVLTHLPASDNNTINAHREDLVQMAISTSNTSLRRLSLALLERLEWDADEARTDLLDFCLSHMARADEPNGIRALCIKLAYYICRHFTELQEELRQSLILMEPTEMGPGVRHTRNKILRLL